MRSRAVARAAAGAGAAARLATLLLVSLFVPGCGDEEGVRRRGQGKPAATRPAASEWVAIGGGRWRVRLAVTEPQWRQGLAGVQALEEDEGMLFIFQAPAVRQFWMRGCLIPLDVAFIDSRRRVVAIHTMPVASGGGAPPTYSSVVAALYALEVPAGDLGRMGVRVGDVASFSSGIEAITKGQVGP